MRRLLRTLGILLIAVAIAMPVSASPGKQLVVISSSSDAYLYSWDANNNYTDVHDRLILDGDNGDVYNDANLYIGQSWYTGMGYNVYRAAVYFDTSLLPANAIIDTVTFRFVRAGIWEDSPFIMHVVDGTGLNDPLTGADYGTLLNRTIGGGNITSANMPSSGVKYEIPFNADGISWVNNSGYTIIGLRTDGDIDISTPVDYEYVCVESSEWGDIHPGEEPTLIIDYHTPAATTTGIIAWTIPSLFVIAGMTAAFVLRNVVGIIILLVTIFGAVIIAAFVGSIY